VADGILHRNVVHENHEVGAVLGGERWIADSNTLFHNGAGMAIAVGAAKRLECTPQTVDDTTTFRRSLCPHGFFRTHSI